MHEVRTVLMPGLHRGTIRRKITVEYRKRMACAVFDDTRPGPGNMQADDFKRWRKWLGLSQKEAAEALGLKRRVVQYYEKGERAGEKVVIPKYVRLACHALAMDIEDYGGPTEKQAKVAKRARKRTGSATGAPSKSASAAGQAVSV